jgi:hypothetical protein
MPQGFDPPMTASTLRISFDLSADGAVVGLAAQGAPDWWRDSQVSAPSVEDLLGLAEAAALSADLVQMRQTKASKTGVEAVCPPGIGARLLRYEIRSLPQLRVELSADARLAALEGLLAELHKAAHDLRTTTATVLASAALLAETAPANPTAARNRSRIEQAIRAALDTNAAHLAQARAKLAALGAEIVAKN